MAQAQHNGSALNYPDICIIILSMFEDAEKGIKHG
jgi:hypothetical protein